MSVPWLIFVVPALLAQPPATKRDLVLEMPSRDSAWQALVIGNSRYQNAPLRNPANDASDFRDFLTRAGYRVTLEQDKTLAGMRASVGSFLKGLGPGGRAVFFFAGHGAQIEGENYLIPVDFAARTEPEATRSAYPLQDLINGVSRAGVRLSVVIVDACRNNPFRPSSRSLVSGLAPIDAPLGTLIALAASPGQKADENPDGRNGLFTRCLLKALSEPVAVPAAMRKARDIVYRESSGAQRPWIHDDVIGDFQFVAAKQEPKSTVASPGPLVEEGVRLYSAGDPKTAAERLDRARRSQPDNPYAHNAAGAAWAAQGEFARAAACYSQAIDLKPDYVAAYMNRGMIYLRAGSYKLALQDFDWALEEDGKDARILRLRGDANFRLKQYEDAEKDFTESLRLNPSDPQAWFGLGLVAERLGRNAQACQQYQRALALKPGLADARSHAGQLRCDGK